MTSIEENMSESQPLMPKDSKTEALVAWRATVLAPILALISCGLFCFNGELLQALQTRMDSSQGHPSLLLNMTLCHLGGLVFLNRAWSSCVSQPGHSEARSTPTSTKFAALVMALLLTTYNYAWVSSSKYLPVGITNAICQLSVALVYVASVMLFAEPLAPGRMMGVILALAGSGLAGAGSTLSTGATPSAQVGAGVALALFAALGVSTYQVAFKYLFGHLKSNVDFLMHFFCWISIWHVLAVGPLILVADKTGFEKLEFPRGGLAIGGTILSAVIASTVNALYLCLVMWGSPMLLPCASVLSVPLSVALDVALHGEAPTRVEAMGHVLVVLAVLLILDAPGMLSQFKVSGKRPWLQLKTPWSPGC